MALQHHYDTMRQLASHQLVHGQAELDPWLIQATLDERRGLTLRARPPAHIIARIQELVAAFQQVEPDQYYYPGPEIHLTISSLISAYPGFTLQQIAPLAYQQVVRHSLAQSRPFALTYSGVTASPGAILLQGFPQGDTLQQLRTKLKRCVEQAGLSHSIDARYALQTAHATLVRFRAPLRQPAQIVNLIQAYQQTFIGSFEVDTLELVYTDWYHRAAHTVVLETYSLDPKQTAS
jgi:2'-5' RNA ligase